MISEDRILHKYQVTTYNECVVSVQKGMKKSLLNFELPRLTKADILYVVGETEPPKLPSEYNPLLVELERLRQSSLTPVNPECVLVKSVVPKVPWSVASSLPWVLSLEKISLPCQRHINIAEGEINGAAIHRQKAEDSCHRKMGLATQE